MTQKEFHDLGRKWIDEFTRELPPDVTAEEGKLIVAKRFDDRSHDEFMTNSDYRKAFCIAYCKSVQRELVAELDAAKAMVARRESKKRMMRYLSRPPKKECPNGHFIVHNFPPGNFKGDPNVQGGYLHDAERAFGERGFRFWITDELRPCQKRCYCGWANDREHYSTYHAVSRALRED